MSAKEVSIVLEGSGEEVPVTLCESTTARDVLRYVGLTPQSALLEVPDGTRIFGPDEKLFSMVESGEKLSASPELKAGRGWRFKR